MTEKISAFKIEERNTGVQGIQKKIENPDPYRKRGEGKGRVLIKRAISGLPPNAVTLVRAKLLDPRRKKGRARALSRGANKARYCSAYKDKAIPEIDGCGIDKTRKGLSAGEMEKRNARARKRTRDAVPYGEGYYSGRGQKRNRRRSSEFT